MALTIAGNGIRVARQNGFTLSIVIPIRNQKTGNISGASGYFSAAVGFLFGSRRVRSFGAKIIEKFQVEGKISSKRR